MHVLSFVAMVTLMHSPAKAKNLHLMEAPSKQQVLDACLYLASSEDAFFLPVSPLLQTQCNEATVDFMLSSSSFSFDSSRFSAVSLLPKAAVWGQSLNEPLKVQS